MFCIILLYNKNVVFKGFPVNVGHKVESRNFRVLVFLFYTSPSYIYSIKHIQYEIYHN